MEGWRAKEENKGFAVFHKNAVPTARSGYLFSCLITCANGYKIGHKKANKQGTFSVRRYADLIRFGTSGTIINH